jgi:alpha-L-rhamnosidase
VTLAGPVRRATWHLSGLGTAHSWINGRDAQGGVLGPGLADHTRVARTLSQDVTGLVSRAWSAPQNPDDQGHLVLAVELGRGFFDLHSPEVWDWSTAPWRDRPRLTAQLVIEYEDGTEELVLSDGDWRCGTGGTRFDSLYEGESWDGRFEPVGWRLPGFSPDAPWPSATVLPPLTDPPSPQTRSAREVATTGLVLRESIAEQVQPVAEYNPTWTRLDDGRFVGDLGRVIAGWVRVDPRTDQELHCSIRHGENRAEDGSVIAENRFIPTGRFQRDDLVLSGEPWEARHTYKGFRYLEVSGVSPIEDLTITAIEAHAPLPVTGDVRTSDATLDWLSAAFTRTVQTNCHFQLTDTPTYEKNGWTGDAQVALPAILTRFDASRFLVSWLDDMLDAQRADGSLPVIVPSAGWGFAPGPCAPAPEWTTLYPVLVDALVREYELDLWPLHAEAVDRHLLHELDLLDADGLAVGILGDYLAPGRGGEPPEDVRLESSLALRYALDVVARCGHSAHASAFAEAAAGLADAVDHVFLDEDAARYAARPLRGELAGREGVGTSEFRQTPQVLALDAGIVPESLRAGVLAALVEDIEARGDHHDVGCLGMARLCSVLVRQGRADLALRVAGNPTAPSWESWRRAGHVTCQEMWVEPVRSRAHYFQGAGVRFLEDDLLGLARTADGWARFRLAPVLPAGVDSLAITRGTVRGDIIATVRRPDGVRAGHIEIELTVPPGSAATVVLPSGHGVEVGPGDHRWTVR